MNAILAQINSRDIAAFVWLAILMAFTLVLTLRERGSRRSFTQSLTQLLKMIFFSKLTLYFVGMVGYVSLLTYVLYRVHFWDLGLAKDTIYWFFGSALALSVGSNDALKKAHYFREAALRGLRLAVLVAFLVNLYVFSLPFELLVLVPFVGILTLFNVVASGGERFTPVKMMSRWLLSLIGLGLLIHVIVQVITNFQSLTTLENLKSFFLPFVLTVLFIPFVYVGSLYGAYEFLYVRLKIFSRDEYLAKFALWQVIKTSGMRLSRVRLFSQEFVVPAGTAKDRTQVMEVIADYRLKLRHLKRNM